MEVEERSVNAKSAKGKEKANDSDSDSEAGEEERPDEQPGQKIVTPQALQRLLAYVEMELRLPLEKRYKRSLDDQPKQGPSSPQEEEWTSKIEPYLQEIVWRAKQAEGMRVGFYGRRGAGKSSLINAILGVDLLPTAVYQTCTAVVSEVSAWDKNFYHASVFFITQEEWNLEVEIAHDLLTSSDGTEEENDDFLMMFHEKVHALCGTSSPGSAEGRWRLGPDHQELLEKRSISLVADDVETLANLLEPYVQAKGNKWPLVDRVYIRGPFEAIQGLSVSLLDIPGIGDGYGSLQRRADEALDTCDSLFFMPPLRESVTKATVQSLKSLGFVPRKGMVVSHLKEILKGAKCTPQEAGRRLKEDLLRQVGSSSYADLAEMPVYCVDSVNHEYRAILEEFIDIELRKARDKDESAHAIQLQNDLNSILVLFREAMGLGKRGETNIPTPSSKLADKFVVSPDTPVPESLLRLLDQREASAVVKSLAALKWNTLQVVLREGRISQTIDKDQLRKIRWTDINSRFQTPDLQQLFGHSWQLDPKILETYQRDLDKECKSVLWRSKMNLDFRIGRCVSEVAKDKIWPQIEGWRGKGLKSRYIKHLESTMSGVWATCLDKAKEELVNWRNEALRDLSAAINSVLRRLRSVLKPLNHQLNDSDREKRAFFRRLLRRIDCLAQPDEAPLREAEEAEPDYIPADLSTIHDLDRILKPIPKKVVREYRDLTYERPGTVYVLANDSFKHNTYKIGRTTRALSDRARQLQSTGVPLSFQVQHSWQTKHAPIFERLMHLLFASVRMAKNREFFQSDLALIKKVGDQLAVIVQRLAQ